MKKVNTIKLKKRKNTFKDYWDVFAFIIKCTFIGFGGGNALYPVINKYAVKKYKWITETEMNEVIITTNLLPGATVMQSLSYIAIKRLGKIGVLVTIIAVLPNVFLAVGGYYLITKLPFAYLYVVNVAVIGIIIAMLFVFSFNYVRQTMKETKATYIFILTTFSFAFAFFVPAPFNIPAFLMFGTLIILFFHSLYKLKKAEKKQNLSSVNNNKINNKTVKK